MHRRQFLKTSFAASLIMTDTGISAPGPDTKPVVVNAGVGGNTTADMLDRIDRDCLANRPDLVILMAGTNDMNSKKYIPLAGYEKNMRQIIARISDIQSRILLMTILPAYEPYLFTRHDPAFYEPEGYAGRKKGVNDLIGRLAVEYGLTLLDMHHIFETVGDIGEDPASLIRNESNSGTKDGLHPTREGCRVMAVAIYECIIQSRLPHERVVCFGDSITAGAYPAYLKKMLEIN